MILISGATGMVGHHLLIALLKQDKKIRALYRNPEKRAYILKRLRRLIDPAFLERLDLVEWVQCDILDVPALELAFADVKEVYHCAGMVSFDERDRSKLRKANIEGTANMVNLSLAYKIEKFCHLSSVAALGSETDNSPVTELSPRNNNAWHSYYNISKYGAEMEVWRASQEGLPIVIVNPAIIIGGGNWNSGSGLLFKQVAKGFPFKVPKGSGFVSVDDVVKAMMILMQSEVTDQRYILVAAIRSIDEITRIIAEKLNASPPRYNLKKWMLYPLWFIQSIGHLLFRTPKQITLKGIPDFFRTANFDGSKIERKFSFQYTCIDQAIATTAEDYLEEHTGLPTANTD